MRWMMGCALALAAAAPLGAQERRVERPDLPGHVADQVIAYFNDPGTIRFQGQADIPEGRRIVGNVAVLGGPVDVAGEIQGDLVVVNGDLTLRGMGHITGDVTVLAGRAVTPRGSVAGTVSVYAEPLRYRESGGGIVLDDRPWARWGERRREGRSYFSVRAEGNYNRVEGLPVMLGPVFRTLGDNQLRLDAMAVWKSESGFRLAPKELGYLLRAEQHMGRDGRFSVGADAHSLVEPISDNGFLNIEASLSAFLLHRDLRDYYEREGFTAFARYDDRSSVSLTVEYRDERQRFLPVGSPWTIKRNDAPWRPLPLIGEGRVRTLGGSAVLDRRNDPDDPSDGWYLEAHTTLGVGGSFAVPAYSLAEPEPATLVQEERPLGKYFRTGSVDLRRYMRLGPGADLRVRGYAAGSLDGEPLPSQYQHALGGEGTLPGAPLMSVDCGARAQRYSVFRERDGTDVRLPVFASYGCDRVALFQAEYRGTLFFDMGWGSNSNWDDDWSWIPNVNVNASWSVFFDAGRGWTLADPSSPAWLGPSSETVMDVGVGFQLGDLGLYWAVPLRGGGKNVNFFVRLDHRF